MYKTEEKEKNNKKWLLIVLLLLFICLSGYVVYELGYSLGQSKRPVAIDPTPQITVIEIKDKDGSWTEGGVVNKISIFSENVNEKVLIAPYDKGIYDFEIQNTTKKSVTYRIYFEETNKDKINMKYKLKKNGEYVIGESDWVYYNEVELSEQLLAYDSTDKFELEWSWVSEDDVLDTKIGSKKNKSPYSLTINVIATENIEG